MVLVDTEKLDSFFCLNGPFPASFFLYFRLFNTVEITNVHKFC